jgi:hypothetical protein
MFDGGFFRGKSFTSEDPSKDNNAEYFFAIAWGKLIADPKVQMFNKRKTSFTIKYHTKSYLNIVIWGESEAAIISSALEKGDMVFCCGTVRKENYTVQKGENKGQIKSWIDFNCQIVIPMASLQFLVAAHASDALNKIIDDGEKEKGEDMFESAGDYEPTQMSMSDFNVTI